jgi:hypothetical protein
MATLGVMLAGDTAWLAVVDEAGEAAAEPDRYRLPNRTRPEALAAALEDVVLTYQRREVTAVGVLDAQGNARPNSYQQARPRFTLEFIFELGAAQAGVPFELLAPATVQSRLGLSSRRIADHVDAVVAPAGTRWSNRGPAALVALAVARRDG